MPVEVGRRGSLNFRSPSVNSGIENPEIAGEKSGLCFVHVSSELCNGYICSVI